MDTSGRGSSHRDTAWRENTYALACRRLGTRLRSQTVIAAPEIGAIGYFCPATILDTVGLITPGLARYYPVPPTQLAANTAIPAALIAARKPEYIITLEAFARYSLLPNPGFRQHYIQILRLNSSAFGSHGLLVFQHRARRMQLAAGRYLSHTLLSGGFNHVA